MSKEFRVGDRVVAEQRYYGDKFAGKTGTVIWCHVTAHCLSILVEFNEPIGFGDIGKGYGGRPGFCAYCNPDNLRVILPSEPPIKVSFEDIFKAF